MAIEKVGDSQTFSYTGGMQAFSVPMAGIYKLEAFGARGGIGNNSGTSSNGLGGYGMGYLILKAGDVIYVCVGGKGANGGGGYGNDVRAAGGYNGGGAGGIHREWFDDGGWHYGKGAGGGGATHFATVSGTIESIGSGGIGKILQVAGGGGGEVVGSTNDHTIGNGGGESGTAGGNCSPGTQTSGYAFGRGQDGMYQFDGWSQQGNGGAGGGLYGGYTNQYTGIPYSGAGGSGYIGGVPVFTYNGKTYSPTWMTGHSSANGNGKATITLVAPYATASNITLSSNSIIPPAAIGVSLENSQMSTINHVVTWTLGSKSHTVELATGAKTTSYTIPQDWLNAMPNAESATGTVTVHTRVGAEVVDTSSAAFTVTAGGDIIPSLSSITLTRIDNDVPAGWGIYVKTKSGIKITANGAAGVYGSSIVSYRYEAVGVNVTQSSNTYTQNPVTGSGSVIYKVTVTDSRGRTNSKSQAVTIYDYQAPAISGIEIIRCQNDGTESDEGTFQGITVSSSISTCNGKNPMTIAAYYRENNATAWNTAASSLTAGIKKVCGTIDPLKIYQIQIRVSDQFTTAYRYLDQPTGVWPIFFKAGGNGVAFGKVSEIENAVEINPNWKLYAGGRDILSELSLKANVARNLLDNSNFKDFIAQAGLNGVHGVVVYAGDRWVGNSLVTTTRINGGVKFKSSDHYAGIRQVVKVRPGVPHTFAVKGTGGTIAMRVYDKNSQAEVGSYNGATFNGIVIAQFTPTEEYVDVWFYPGFADGGGESTLEWAALYEGAYTAETLPPYVPKGYVTELMECQRYFLTCSSVPFFRYAGGAGTEYFAGGMRFPVPMRIIPSIVAYCDVVNVGPVTPSMITYDSESITAFGCESASPIPQGIRAYMMFTASADL